MADAKLVLLIQKMMDKTATGQLHWEVAAQKDGFQVSFTDYSVILSGRASRGMPGNLEYVLSVYNSQGQLIDEVGDEDLKPADLPPNPYNQMKAMYNSARRIALGVDAAINKLLEEIGD